MKQFRFEEVPKQSCGAGIIETILENGEKTLLHTHDFYELFIMKYGCLRHENNGGSCDMKRGDFCVVREADCHCFQKISAEKASFVNISFSTAFFQELLAGCGLEPEEENLYSKGSLSPPQMNAVEESLGLLTGMGDRSEQDRRRKRELLKSLLSLILLSKIVAIHQQPPSAPAWLQQAIHALQQPDVLHDGLKGFIRICGRSQEYVTRQVRKYYHQSPSELVNYYRIEYAKNLLSATELSVLEISMRSGYESVSYFNRIFLRYTGVSPRTYRNSTRLFRS